MKATPLPLQTQVGASDAQPPVIGGALLRPLDRLFLRSGNAVRRHIPDALNPLLQIGAIANVVLIVAIASGILLLIWYTPSHSGAWESTRAMGDAPLTAGLMRSLHRYSSDATLLFAFLHGLQVLAARRVAGPRWVAWVTGMLAVGLIWFIGWLGYWLVWDERAQLVAVGTAQALDVLPIFSDPLSRSFITNESVSSLLFFVVFFMHMLLPLIIAVLLWLHLSRLARPRFLAPRTLTLWVVGTLVALSLILPAQSAAPADMTNVPGAMTMDWWYLLPVALTDRLSGGLLWLVVFVLGVVVLGAPWWLVRARSRPLAPSGSLPPPVDREPEACRVTGEPTPPSPAPPTRALSSQRRAPPALVDEAKCNACETCFRDCPYDAISMVARTDGRKFPSVAVVDPARCVGCGICAGSCDSSGIGLDWLPAPTERHRMDAWLEAAAPATELIAFCCARSAATDFTIDADGRSTALPGYRVISIPCAGWVHPLTVERALRRGAAGVLVAGCRPGHCAYREGASWTGDRLSGVREPELRKDHADLERVLFLSLDAPEAATLLSAAEQFRHKCIAPTAGTRAGPATTTPTPKPNRWRRIAVGLFLAVAFGALTWLPSDLPYDTPVSPEPQLVVSFKHAGEITERCTTRSAAELERLPPHKRVATVCERGRAPVHLTIRVDDQVVLDRDYEPSGAYGDGASVAVETLAVPVGRHRVSIVIGSPGAAGDPDQHRDERELDFRLQSRRVALFDRVSGFTWH